MGGSSYPWFMAGCPILIPMSSLTFLLNQMSSLAGTLVASEKRGALSTTRAQGNFARVAI